MQLVFDFFPECGAAQALFHGFSHGASSAHSIDAQPIGNVVEDRFRKRVGFLKDHPDATPETHDIQGKDVFAIQQNFALGPCLRNRFVHAIENAQKGGLAAAGRSDESGNPAGGDLQGNGVQRLLSPIVKIESRRSHLDVGRPGSHSSRHSFGGMESFRRLHDHSRNTRCRSHGSHPLSRHPKSAPLSSA